MGLGTDPVHRAYSEFPIVTGVCLCGVIHFEGYLKWLNWLFEFLIAPSFQSVCLYMCVCVCVNFLYLLFSGKSLPLKTPRAMLSHVLGVSCLCCA